MCDVCATAFGHFPGCPTLDDDPDYQEDDFQEDDYQEDDCQDEDDDDEIKLLPDVRAQTDRPAPTGCNRAGNGRNGPERG